ncbi:hypothetical protein C8R30_102147 [Nitrosomonas nitrosa]|nr:hypothetical protein C8R30_102147 [Nitrosomonas nitrosa]
MILLLRKCRKRFIFFAMKPFAAHNLVYLNFSSLALLHLMGFLLRPGR